MCNQITALMRLGSMASTHTTWAPEHFIGGHPALDLCNAVYDRRHPIKDNELLTSARDVGNWFLASGLADDRQAEAIAGITSKKFVLGVHDVREATFEVFDAIASEAQPSTKNLGSLFTCVGGAFTAETFALPDLRMNPSAGQWKNPHVVTSILALLSLEAFFVLPRERIHACPRCGWLFVDKSRGGKRRWCNMRICGNRDKVTRYREGGDH